MIETPFARIELANKNVAKIRLEGAAEVFEIVAIELIKKTGIKKTPLRFFQNASTFETKRKDVLGKTQGRLNKRKDVSL